MNRFLCAWFSPLGTAVFIVFGLSILSLGAIFQSGVQPAQAQTLNISVVPVVSSSAQDSLVIKATPGLVYAVYATNETSTAGKLMLFNATAEPADGAVTPLACVTLPASGSVSMNYVPSPPARFTTGITAVASSAATCFTKTTGTITAFFSAIIQ